MISMSIPLSWFVLGRCTGLQCRLPRRALAPQLGSDCPVHWSAMETLTSRGTDGGDEDIAAASHSPA